MIFELLFIVFVLASIIALMTDLLVLRTKRLLKGLGISWLVYLSVVLLVSATMPQQIIPLNQNLCFDDMCFAVIGTQTAREVGPSNHPVRASGVFRIVTVRVSSQARARSQSEGGLRALLWSPGREYGASASGQSAWDAAHPENAALTSRLHPGQSVLSYQVFDIPPDAPDLALVLSHGFTPGYFVVGECPLLHKPTILRLSPRAN